MPFSDLIILAVVLFFTIKGWMKGFFIEFFTFFGFIAAFFTANAFYAPGGIFLHGATGFSLPILKAVIFVLIFIAVVFISIMIGSFLNKKMEKFDLTQADHTLGSMFGLAQGLFLSGLAVLLLMKHPIFTGIGSRLRHGSFFARLTLNFLAWLEKAVS